MKRRLTRVSNRYLLARIGELSIELDATKKDGEKLLRMNGRLMDDNRLLREQIIDKDEPYAELGNRLIQILFDTIERLRGEIEQAKRSAEE